MMKALWCLTRWIREAMRKNIKAKAASRQLVISLLLKMLQGIAN